MRVRISNVPLRCFGEVDVEVEEATPEQIEAAVRALDTRTLCKGRDESTFEVDVATLDGDKWSWATDPALKPSEESTLDPLDPEGSSVSMRYEVLLPTLTTEDWKTAGEFETREEALAFAQEKFGADAKGRVSLISSYER